MPLPKDPMMLLSVVNTLLRDRYQSLDALCEEEGLGRAALESRLADAGFHYRREMNQFR